MKQLNLENVKLYVENNIGDFHAKRLSKIESLRLNDVLLSKNPYLFKAKNITTAEAFVTKILDAFLSSSEEGIFGNWLERLAIYINDSVFQGRKAGIDGIDLDFDKDGNRYLISIKSGPNWANGDQIKKMVDQFNTARKRFKTSGSNLNIVCVNGCCYGRSTEKNEYKAKGDYYKICGKRFWELISGDPSLFTKLIEPLGFKAEIRNQEFNEAYNKLINRFTRDFLIDFCLDDGSIEWEKLVIYNSSTTSK
jgi:hypothetical protein